MKACLILISIIGVFGKTPISTNGWKPSSESYNFSALIPHRVYGPPSIETNYHYNKPDRNSDETSPEAAEASSKYGFTQNVGAKYRFTEEQINDAPHNNNYRLYQDSYRVPNNNYGTPDNEYDGPQNNHYGTPRNTYVKPEIIYEIPDNTYGESESTFEKPENDYGKPVQGMHGESNQNISGKIKHTRLELDLGALEMLGQSHFIQNLPHFEPSKFREIMVSQPLRKMPVFVENKQYRTISQEDYKKNNIRNQRLLKKI